MNERLIEGNLPNLFQEPKVEPVRRTLGHELKIVFSGILHRDREIVREARKGLLRR